MVGGGVAGLAAAHRIVERAPGTDVVLVEQAAIVGGKLRTGEIGGIRSETGAESFLVRGHDGGVSAAVTLARAVGLADALVHPAAVPAAIAVDGELRELPKGTLMGVPADASTLDGWLTAGRGADQDLGRPLLAPGEDITVGSFVRERLGDRIVDLLVDPLLGGVYSGRADALSLRMTVPLLAEAAESAHTLGDAVRMALRARRTEPGAPVFATVEGGLSRLVEAVATQLTDAKVDLRRGVPVRGVTAADNGRWRLVLGPTPDPKSLDVDGIVLAVPANPARRLLSAVDGSLPLPHLEYASVALVPLAFAGLDLPRLSGFLVPATEGYATKAVTFFDRKWSHLRRDDGFTVVRASLGRAGEEHLLQRDDADLIEIVRTELSHLLGVDALPPHTAAAVYRWGGALPQYPPGHGGRVAALRAVLAERHPALALAGAAYDGVGIPACVTSGRAAADLVLDDLGE